MEVKVKLTEQDVIDFNLHHLKTSPTLKKSILIQRLIGPICFTLFIGIGYRVSTLPLWYLSSMFIIASILWYKFYPKRIEKKFKKQVNKIIEEGTNKDIFAESTIIIDEEKIVKSSEYTDNTIKWDAIEKIDICDKHIFIYNSSISAIIIPLSIFNSQDEQNEFINKTKNYYNNNEIK
jgi:hypothetical protein